MFVSVYTYTNTLIYVFMYAYYSSKTAHILIKDLFCLRALSAAPAMNVGPCHHGMMRPRVADGGTAFNTEGSCE